MRWAERTVLLRATRWEAEPELSQSSRRGSLYISSLKNVHKKTYSENYSPTYYLGAIKKKGSRRSPSFVCLLYGSCLNYIDRFSRATPE